MAYKAFLNAQELRSFAARSWSVAWPMTTIMLFEFLISVTDVYVAGKISEEIQAAYGFVVQLYFIMIVVANALSVGTVSVVSRLYTSPECDQDRLTEAISSSNRAVLAGGITLAVLSWILAPHIIAIVNIPAQLKDPCVSLMRVYALGLPLHYLLINTNAVLRSSDRVKQSLKTMAIVCGLNVTLIFIYVFHAGLGFRGIGFATVTAVAIGGIVNYGFVRGVMKGVHRFTLGVVGRMFAVGWPIGVLQVVWQLGSAALFIILSGLPEHRVEILAAFTAGVRIESAIFLPAFACNLANAVIVGNFIGEGKLENAYRSGIVTAGLAVAIVTFMTVAVIVNARWIAALLSPNPIVAAQTVTYIYVSMISEPFMAWGIALGGGLSGAGDTRAVALRVAFSIWAIRIPLAFILVRVFGLGASAVWWSMNVSQIVQAFIIYRRYTSRTWLPPQ